MKDLFYNKEIEFFITKLKNDEHFKYSRFNDGELIAVSQSSPVGNNCDGHSYFPEMGKRLLSVLLNYKPSNHYFIESWKYWYDELPHIKRTVDAIHRDNPELMCLPDDFIRRSHENDPIKFIELLETLKNKKLVIVGPDYLSNLSRFFDFYHIIVPTRNCYLETDRIISDIKKINVDGGTIFLFSASMATNIIIDEFAHDENNTYLDWGSVWDTFFVSDNFNFIRKRSTSSNPKYKSIYKEYLI